MEIAVLVVPAEGVYHSAFPDFGGSEDNVTVDGITDFESLVQKRIVWAYFSNNWLEGIQFPELPVRIIHDQGIIPFIRMMARSSIGAPLPDPVYSMQRIIDGHFDRDLQRWAQRAKEVGIPLMVEFGTEVNGDWFPWNEAYNGDGQTKGYGDPSLPDGPERFRDAYRHIIDICRAERATDITWVFHVNADSLPREPLNTMAAYYPGDDYIDWIGFSAYGPERPREEWKLFSDIMDAAYPELATISEKKPLAALEYGVVDDPHTGDKAAWIHDALQSVRNGRYPRIKEISYWHENWQNEDGTISNMRLDSSPEALAAYREGIGDLFFLSEPASLATALITTIQGTATSATDVETITKTPIQATSGENVGELTPDGNLGGFQIAEWVYLMVVVVAFAGALAMHGLRRKCNRARS